jgi:hypothetical protein
MGNPMSGQEEGGMNPVTEGFLEFRRKVRNAEMLSASMERLLVNIEFTGRLSIVVQNGRVLKSGYEEGYFTRRHDAPLLT